MIDKRTCIKLLILWIVFCAGIVISGWLQKAIPLIFAFICLGLFLVGFYVKYTTSWKANFEFIITLLIAVIGIILGIHEPPFIAKLDHCYFNNNTVKFEKWIQDENLHNHRFIFAIDNSGGFLDSLKSDKLKSRLCNDLTQIEQENDHTNDFIIMKIGEPLPIINEGDWIELIEGNVKQNKNSVSKLKPINNISDFYNFYKTIVGLCENNNYTYTLFIYSDFIHDLTKEQIAPKETEKKKLDEDFLQIRKWQEELERKKVTQNLFFIPKPDILQDERNVLPEENTAYINRFDFDSNNLQQTPIPHKIEEINNNLPFFYFKNIFKTRSSLHLIFKKQGNHIEDIGNKFKIYDGKSVYSFNSEKPNSLNNEIVKIEFEGPISPENMPKIKIIQNGRHYLFTCFFEENNNVWWRLWWFLIFIIISLIIGIIGFLFNKKGNS